MCWFRWRRLRRESFQALEERTIEAGDLRGGFVALDGERKTRDQNVIGAEAEVDFAEGDEAAHEKSGGDEKCERERHFEDDNGAAKLGVTETPAETFANIAQGIV